MKDNDVKRKRIKEHFGAYVKTVALGSNNYYIVYQYHETSQGRAEALPITQHLFNSFGEIIIYLEAKEEGRI